MRWIMVVLGLTLLTGCERAPEPPVEAEPVVGLEGKEGIAVSDASIVLPVVEGRPGAAYMTVANDGAAMAELAAIYVDGAEHAELHESLTQGGAMSMKKIATIAVPSSGSVALEQGGLHAMVFGLSPAFEGDSVEITLIFADGDKTSLDARVTRIGGAEN